MEKSLILHHYLGWPLWGQFLLQGILIFTLIAATAVALGKAGRNPYLAFQIAVPYVQIIALWVFAFAAWKKKKR